jgi:hypothetical protein
MVRLEKMRNFRRDQSYLAFTGRDYGVNSITQIGWFNDLRVHGWDPATIVDETTRYAVKLTGTGTSDVTLHRLQKLPHNPGTTYAVKLNGADAGTVKADEWGLVTVPKVKDAALIELTVTAVGIRDVKAGAGAKAGLSGGAIGKGAKARTLDGRERSGRLPTPGFKARPLR